MTSVRLCPLILCLGGLWGLSGCTLGRSNVSIDSNSRAPWMNLELMPSRKKEKPANYHRSVAEQRGDGAKPVEVQEAMAAPRRELKLPQWMTPSSERTPLPLPRTDADLDISHPGSITHGNPEWYDF